MATSNIQTESTDFSGMTKVYDGTNTSANQVVYQKTATKNGVVYATFELGNDIYAACGIYINGVYLGGIGYNNLGTDLLKKVTLGFSQRVYKGETVTVRVNHSYAKVYSNLG